jgi:ABC-type tungstate transport system, permease component
MKKLKLIALVAMLAVAMTASAFLFAACDKDEGAPGGQTPTYVNRIPNLEILYENDPDLKNTYSMIAVNPSKFTTVDINTTGADAFIHWMTSPKAYLLIIDYKKAEFGESLFSIPDTVTMYGGAIPAATDGNREIRVSTTTSVNDSGLLDYLVPRFEEEYGYDVQIASAGTGAAIQAAKDGNADMILVHSKSQEDLFVSDGYARTLTGYPAERIVFMYNFFVLVGPKADPAGVKAAANAKAAFAAIATAGSVFVSRGDNSGTHTKEVSLWPTALNIISSGAPAELTWYNHTGLGMGACLLQANELNGYVLSDKATFLAYTKAEEE